MEEFKNAQVIMLPTDSKSLISKGINIPSLFYCPKFEKYNNEAEICQHLYIISDDMIEDGDWVYRHYEDGGSHIGKATPKADNLKRIKDKRVFKIIATTDKLLGLAEPSKQFIKKYIEIYNADKPIIDILVKYELKAKCLIEHTCNCDIRFECNRFETKSFTFKVNPKNNSITIKKLTDS